MTMNIVAGICIAAFAVAAFVAIWPKRRHAPSRSWAFTDPMTGLRDYAVLPDDLRDEP